MKISDFVKGLELENHHYDLRRLSVPVVDAALYTTLGRRLFELYKKLQISSEDQREIERLAFALQIFTLSRESRPPFWKKFFRLRRKS